MAGLGAALAVLLAVLLAGIVLLLVLPLRIELVLRKEAGLAFTVALRPLGGFGPRIRLSGRRQPHPAAKKPGRSSMHAGLSLRLHGSQLPYCAVSASAP